jgi:phage shock protein A
MFESLRQAFREAVDNFRTELNRDRVPEAADRLLKAMERELVAARAHLARLEEDAERTEKDARSEEEEARTCLRREEMARRIEDEETARVAREFAAKHLRRKDLLDEKAAVLRRELADRRTEVDEMTAQLKSARAHRQSLLATASRSGARSRMQQAENLFDELDRMAERIQDLEARGEAAEELERALDPDFRPDPERGAGEDDLDARLEELAAVIATMEADIVALQEVALLNVDAKVQDQATALSQLTDMEARFGAVRHFPLPEQHYGEVAHGAGLFGNAILSRLPITDSRVLALPHEPATAVIEPEGEDHPLSGVRWMDLDHPMREPRCLLLSTVTLPDGRDLTIGSTHFTHVGSG